jgi:hypothetical protein
MGLDSATRALLTSLRDEATTVVAPETALAPWVAGGAANVHLRKLSSVVELSGANAGSPQAYTWPVLLLFGPDLDENVTRRAEKAREVLATDTNAGNATVRDWPSFYDLTFTVLWAVRANYTPAGVTPQAQLFDGITRFQRWARRVKEIDGARLDVRTMLAPSKQRRAFSAADVLEAVGEVKLYDVREYPGPTRTVPVMTAAVVRPNARDELP